MAPDKFEKYIKEKLRQREIAPSDEAWNKIEGQLPEAEEKRKRPFIWYAVAASFVGILIIGLYVTRSPEPESDLPGQIVVTEENTPDSKKDTELKEVQQGNQIPETKQLEILAESPVQDKNNKVENDIPEAISPSPEQELAVAETPEPIEENTIAPGEFQNREDLIIEAKITEVVAEVRLLEMDSEALTEAEVDSLLRRAQGEILKEKIFNSDRTVDAMALLNEVEDELDQSFRDQIFDKLKAGFNKVRTAVADRNN